MNNEIEVGDFVKLKQGYIGTVENINDFREPSMKYAVDIQKRDLVFVGDDDIVKHSKIKSEIVEVGDYVNGKLIHKIDKGPNYCYLYYGNCKTFVDYQIKTIVTKESFKEREYFMKIVINDCFGGFSISEEAKKYCEENSSYNISRTNEKLIEFIEKYGSKRASGLCASLKIVEIPDDVDWEIEEYDGNEWVAEVHRTWQ